MSELVGDRSRRVRLLALQPVLSDLDVRWHDSPTVNTILCCPQCGEEHRIEGWENIDRTHDCHYVGLRCPNCDWSEGGEV